MTTELNFTTLAKLQAHFDASEDGDNLIPKEIFRQIVGFNERISKDCGKDGKVFIERCAIIRGDGPPFHSPTRKLEKFESVIYELQDKTICSDLLKMGNHLSISRYFTTLASNSDYIIITLTGLALLYDDINYEDGSNSGYLSVLLGNDDDEDEVD